MWVTLRMPIALSFVIVRERFRRANLDKTSTYLLLTRLNVALQKWVHVEHDELMHADDAAHDEDDEHLGVVRHVSDLKLSE